MGRNFGNFLVYIINFLGKKVMNKIENKTYGFFRNRVYVLGKFYRKVHCMSRSLMSKTDDVY